MCRIIVSSEHGKSVSLNLIGLNTMKTYKIRKHHSSGKDFVANSYASHKALSNSGLSFAEKLDIAFNYVKKFTTENPIHIKQVETCLTFIKTLKSLPKIDRQTAKIQLNILVESEYGTYIDFQKVSPQKLGKLIFDLNLSESVVQNLSNKVKSKETVKV